MRCISCDVRLTEQESKLKHAITGEYLDMCSDCLGEVLGMVSMPLSGSLPFVAQSERENDDE